MGWLFRLNEVSMTQLLLCHPEPSGRFCLYDSRFGESADA
jgi:hypothetical protein